MTLQSTVAVTATMSAVATIVAIVLIVLTSALNDVNARLAMTIERVRLLMELESHALQANREAARGMMEVLSRLQNDYGDEFDREMQALVDNVTLIETALTPAEREARAAFAMTSLRNVVVRENDEGREATALAASWRRLANIVALGGISVLMVGFVVPLVWIQRRTLEPLVAIGAALERFAVGDHTVRAPQTGPAECRRLAMAFNEMAVALQQQHERQLAFVGGVAHDLRNPLSTLRVAGMLLQRRPENAKDVGDRITRQVDQLERLVNDLLDRTQIESGRLELHCERHDLRDVVARAVDEQRDLMPARVFRRIEPERPVVVTCDVVRIGQVLRNLLSNAGKYSPDSTDIVVRLELRGAHARVAVTDAGIGVAASDRERLFQPFVRGENVGTVGGMGLGLSVSRKIIEGHGGRIEVESGGGAGSTFFVWMPLAQASSVPDVTARLEGGGEAPDASSPPGHPDRGAAFDFRGGATTARPLEMMRLVQVGSDKREFEPGAHVPSQPEI